MICLKLEKEIEMKETIFVQFFVKLLNGIPTYLREAFIKVYGVVFKAEKC